MKNAFCFYFVYPRSLRLPARLFLAVFLGSLNFSSAQTQIFKANNTNALDQGTSWVGGAVPNSGNIIVYNNSNTASTTGTIGNGISVSGILFSTNPGTSIAISNATGGTGVLGLGSSGIDIRSSTNRSLTISTPISLNADQTWYTGLANANTAMINANGVVSGEGRLTIAGASGSSNQYVFFATNNTFSGGLTLNSGGAVKAGSTNAIVSGSTVLSNMLGIGSFTINGGTIFGGSGTLAFPNISVNGDFAVNSGTNANSARLTLGGGLMDLGGSTTRIVSLGRWTNATAALSGGGESLKLAYLANSPAIMITNGLLRFVRGSGAGPSDYVSVNFAGGASFASGAGMIIGSNVFVTFSGGSPFTNSAGGLPTINLEPGSYFNLGALIGPQSVGQIRSLTGSGIVTSIATNTNPNIPLLTFNTPAGDVADFSGSVLDGANLNSTLGITTTSPVVVSLSKSGLGTQILSGSNNHTGTITNTAGELRFSRRVSLYAGNTNLWSNLAVNSGATLGLSLGGTEGFTSADLNTLVGNTGIIKAGAKIGLDVAASNSPATLATVFSNSANPNGVAFSKTGAGQLTLSGYSGNLTNSMTVNGGTLRFTNLSTYSGTPSLSGGAVLDLGGATFPIPNTVAITDGSMVNFTPGVADPFAPTTNVTYTGFSFAVNRLNDGTNGTRTFTLTNSVLTVGGEVATNGFTISGASNGIMRFTGATTGQGDTNSTKGQITLNGSAILEFASNAVFDSYRALSISSASNPTVLVSGGNISNLSYVIFGAASTTTGTLRVTSGSLSVANPNPSGNGLFFGQNFGVGTLLLEGGSVSTPVIKVQSGRANINVSGGSLNIVTTNAPGAPANTWALSLNGAVNFTMTGGSIVATNSKFNLSTVNSTNFLTNVVYQHNGGVIRSIEMSAGAGSFLMSAGTNVASAGMFVGDNSNGVATFTQTGGLMQILGEAGSTAANDLVIGSANGNGIYQLNGGVLEVFGKIRKNSGTSSLVLNGGVLRSTNGTNQGAFISSPVETKVGSNGAIFEITDAGVTNTVQATLSDVSGQSGKLIKRGAGALALARSNLSYSGSTRVENGLLVVTDTAINAGFTAQISSNAISMTFSNPPASNLSSTNTYPILPANLEGGTASIVATQLAGNQPITFDPATGTAQVITTALGSSTISVTGSANFTYDGTPQGPDTCDTTGSTGVVTYEYAGTGGTSYGPSATKPTGAGSYTVTASLAGDSNHYAATSSAYAFTIIKATPNISQVPTAGGITSGQALSASLLSGGTGSVGGGFAWTDSTVIPIGTGSFSVTFTPTDTANYNTTTTNVNVIVSPAGPTFANAYSNLPTDVAPNGLTYLVNYAFGGTSTNDPKLPQLDTTDPTRLALVAYVRTNDTGGALLQVKGQKGASLSSWDPNLIDGVPTGDNYGAPAGTQKQIFSVTNGGERLFLRLKVTQ